MTGKVKLSDVAGEKPAVIVEKKTHPVSNSTMVTETSNATDPNIETSEENFVKDYSDKAAIGVFCVFGIAAFYSIMGFIGIATVATVSLELVLFASPILLFGIVMAVLGYFMLEKSRTAAIIAFAIYAINFLFTLWQMFEGGNFDILNLGISIALVAGLWMGVDGISAYHRHQKSLQQENKSTGFSA